MESESDEAWETENIQSEVRVVEASGEHLLALGRVLRCMLTN